VGANVVAYRLFYTPQANPEEYPSKILEDLLAGQLDVALVWGPWAGYFVKQHSAPIALVPLSGGSRAIPFSFDISIGVRKGEKALKAELEEALDRQTVGIKTILEEYGIPLVAAEASAGEEKGAEVPGAGHQHKEGTHGH
jgi:mxaJ protein